MANAAVDASQFLANLIPMFAGSGTETKTETSPGAAGANDDIHSLLATILPQITGTAETDAVVQNIMARSAQAFAPISFQGNNASGLYNNSAVTALAGEARARATGEAATAVLGHQTDAAKIAAQLTGQITNLSSQTKTSTAKTAPAVNPLVSGALAAAGIAKSVFAKKPKDDSDPSLPPGTSDVFGSARDAAAEFSRGSTLGTEVGTSGQSIGGATSALGNVEGGFDSALSTSSAMVNGVDAASTIADAAVAAPAVAAPVVDINGTAAGVDGFGQAADIAAGVEGAGSFAAADAAGAIGGDVLTGGIAGAAGDIGAIGVGAEAAGAAEAFGWGDAALAAGEATSIVCYELVRTGGMDKKYADISSAYAPKLSKAVIRGYHHICPWLLVMMHKHRWAYRMLQVGAIARAKELESSSLFGKLMRVIFEPICWVVGVTAAKDAPLKIDIQEMLRKNALLYDLPK